MFSPAVKWNSGQFRADDGNFSFFWCAFTTKGQGQIDSTFVIPYSKASDECALFPSISLCAESDDLTSGKTSKATVLKSLVNNKSKRQKREKQKVYLTLIPPVGTEAHTHTHYHQWNNQSRKDKASLTIIPGFRSSQSHTNTGWNSGFQKSDIEEKWELFNRYLVSFCNLRTV